MLFKNVFVNFSLIVFYKLWWNLKIHKLFTATTSTEVMSKREKCHWEDDYNNSIEFTGEAAKLKLSQDIDKQVATPRKTKSVFWLPTLLGHKYDIQSLIQMRQK